MATLTVKDLPEPVYQRLRARAQQHGRPLDEEVIGILTEAVQEPGSPSILALKGLGENIWRGVEAARFVAEERRSWD